MARKKTVQQKSNGGVVRSRVIGQVMYAVETPVDEALTTGRNKLRHQTRVREAANRRSKHRIINNRV